MRKQCTRISLFNKYIRLGSHGLAGNHSTESDEPMADMPDPSRSHRS